MDVKQLIIKHEGYLNKMYADQKGIATIGVGHNLRDNPISDAAVNQIFQDDFNQVCKGLLDYPWFQKQNEARQAVLVDMAFNMGLPTLLKFQGMIAALTRADYATAALEMLDSSWARQVPSRAKEDSDIMRSGSF